MWKMMTLTVLLLVAGGGQALGQSDDLAGRYDFEAVSAEGDRFTGTVLAEASGDGYGGWIFTTINTVGSVVDIERHDAGVRMRFDVRGRDIVFDVQFSGDEFEGGWTLMDLSGPVSGQRVATNARGDLKPVPCRMPGLGDPGECGILHVPENRADPSSRWIPLSVYVLPAREEPSPQGALFHFAGGPGQAATEQASGNARRFGRILQTRDVVMIDQRGTGDSNPLRCPYPGAVAHIRTILAWDLPGLWISACAEELRQVADLRHYTTADAAADVEAVREWLGYDEIDLYGGSYGTRAALEYARYYPDRVRTMTLRGVMPPSGIMAIENPLNVDRALNRVFNECRQEAECAEAYPDLQDEYDQLLDRLVAGVDTAFAFDEQTGDSIAVAVDQRVLAGSLRRLLMDADGWLQVPLAIHRASSSDWSAIVPGIESTLAITNSLYLGMSLSVMCAEEAPRLRSRDWRGETRGTLMGPWAAEAISSACGRWDAGTPGPGYGAPVAVETPMLVLSGDLDPTTPASWGQLAADAAQNSLHLVLDGVSHSPFPDCALDVMADFVAAGTLENLDTGCTDELQRGTFMLP
jgi:pimeloyl-ACP methyl ester carboxylesterase